jgi:ribosomal protein S18 acetylase RimI-like enzyme
MKELNMTIISRRAAMKEDIPFLLELRRKTMSAHLSASGVVTSEEEHLRRVLFRFECAEIVLLDNRLVGLLKVARDGLDWELIQIQLRPSFQGQGLGEKLVEEIITEAKRAGASLRLSVLASNPARRLYERLGFSVVMEKPHAFEMQLNA